MSTANNIKLSELVRPDSVHRPVYPDERIFRMEMEYLFDGAWLFVGHESQGDRIRSFAGPGAAFRQ